MRTAKTKISLSIRESDQGLQCPLTESLDTKMHERRAEGQMILAHAQAGLTVRILRMYEDTFSLDSAKLIHNRKLFEVYAFVRLTYAFFWIFIEMWIPQNWRGYQQNTINSG